MRVLSLAMRAGNQIMIHCQSRPEDGSGFRFGVLLYLWFSHDDLLWKEGKRNKIERKGKERRGDRYFIRYSNWGASEDAHRSKHMSGNMK